MDECRRNAMHPKPKLSVSHQSAIGFEGREQIHILMDNMIGRILRLQEKRPQPDLGFDELRELCLRCRSLFLKEPALLEIKPPLMVFGDLHGQLLDLQRMITACGMPPTTRYLFLGDYVDRGAYSVETVSLVMAFKLRYPTDVFLLRGNHETRVINHQYGFLDECRRKYGNKGNELWTLFQHAFNCLPLAAVIDRRIFCAHGGISQYLKNFNQFKMIERPTDVCDMGLLADIIWSDPSPQTENYEDSPRQISRVFGRQAIHDFCKRFDIDLICRAHQCVQDGYAFFASRRCLTIFSAPHYCGQLNNLAGILCVSKDLKCQIFTYDPVMKSCRTQRSEPAKPAASLTKRSSEVKNSDVRTTPLQVKKPPSVAEKKK